MGQKKQKHIRLLLTFILIVFIVPALAITITHHIARDTQTKMVQEEAGLIAAMAALAINGDLHTELAASPKNKELYEKAITPLVQMHQRIPALRYLYTRITKNGKQYYILDTATKKDVIDTKQNLVERPIMTPVSTTTPEDIEMLKIVYGNGSYADRRYVFKKEQRDNDGKFVSAFAPIINSKMETVGHLGADFTLDTYYNRINQAEKAVYAGLAASLILSIIVGIMLWRSRLALYREREKLAISNKNLQAAYRKIEAISQTDKLTQIANRRHFDKTIKNEWLRLRRTKLPLTFMILDIDHFKFYNDHYGHQAGDNCLKTVAQTIKKSVLRPADFVARYGGEEFAVILPDTSAHGGETVAERIQENIKTLQLEHADSPTNPHVTVSIGIKTMIPTQNETETTIIKGADKALYFAKEKGRNQFCFDEDPS